MERGWLTRILAGVLLLSIAASTACKPRTHSDQQVTQPPATLQQQDRTTPPPAELSRAMEDIRNPAGNPKDLLPPERARAVSTNRLVIQGDLSTKDLDALLVTIGRMKLPGYDVKTITTMTEGSRLAADVHVDSRGVKCLRTGPGEWVPVKTWFIR